MNMEWLEKIPGVKTEESLYHTVIDSHAPASARVVAGAVLVGEAVVVAGVATAVVRDMRANPFVVIKSVIEDEAGGLKTSSARLGKFVVNPIPDGFTASLTPRSTWLGFGQEYTYRLSPVSELSINSTRATVMRLCGKPLSEIPYAEGTALTYNNNAMVFLRDGSRVANWHDPHAFLPVPTRPNGNEFLRTIF